LRYMASGIVTRLGGHLVHDAQNFFYNRFYFMPLHASSTCAHHQEVKIALRSLWYNHTHRWPSCAEVENEVEVEVEIEVEAERVLSQPVHQTATYTCDDTRGCIIQFRPHDDEHMVLETCRCMK